VLESLMEGKIALEEHFSTRDGVAYAQDVERD
jgi:hypothetical protein